jgi:hypothetical protein
MGAMRAKDEPRSVRGFVFRALLALVIGTGAACVELALRPVYEVSAGTSVDPGRIQCVIGSNAPSSSYQTSLRMLGRGYMGEYICSEGDINSWIAENLTTSQAPVMGLLRVSTLPNFCLAADGMVGVSCHLSVPGIGGNRDLVYQAAGVVERGRFRPAKAWLGQCPVPLLGALILASVQDSLTAAEAAAPIVQLRDRIGMFSEEGMIVVSLAD